MSVIISVTNSKGGVGKSTTALNLGAALCAAGNRVLLIDNDVQGNLTAALGFTPAELKHTLAKLLLAAIDSPEDVELHLPRAILHTESGMDLIPANARLSDAAARLQVMQLSQYNAVGEADRPCEKVMCEMLERLRGDYDYIIIDCGLKYELLTVNALAAADYCIVPVQAHYLASEGIMNRAYALNRDKLKCRICGGWLIASAPYAHRINPNLPLNKVNRVNNLVSLHKKCFDAVNNPNVDVHEFDIKAQKKIIGYREKLVNSHTRNK